MTAPAEATEIEAVDTPPEGPCLLRSITLRNLLSFGPDTPPLELRSLNVLIGPNGSGKSNLIDAIALLRSMPVEPSKVISDGGGVEEWVWKGAPTANASILATSESGFEHGLMAHQVGFSAAFGQFSIEQEQIHRLIDRSSQGATELLYDYHDGSGVIVHAKEGRKRLNLKTLRPSLSILKQRSDPEAYPHLYFLAWEYERIAIYRDWAFGRNTVFRMPQRADMPNNRLEEDFSNLGLILNRLRRNPKAKAAILTRLRDLYEELTDFDVSIQGGAVQVFFTEGTYTIPATRLSDGSLRYLCLLAILCDPEPPPLVCIEEPELGLHPDLLHKIADLLVEASERTQLIVTTHSDVIVDSMTDTPENVVICEKHNGQTTMRRLSEEKLKPWLKDYRLGPLWTSGQLGGVRW